MRLLLVNPSNRLISLTRLSENRWNRYRIWQPLGLMAIAGATSPEWEIKIIDENLHVPDYGALPRPDLVGITAFTSQASRAYALAARFRQHGVPVVMGGIHATTCAEEAMTRVDAIVAGEGEQVWPQVLEDARRGSINRRYDGGQADLSVVTPPRHDLLPDDAYYIGSVQTTRGCPLDCSFCSVKALNGSRYRQRPIADVVHEITRIREKGILVVDDNLIGTRSEHILRAKELFRAMIQADLRKEWIAQVTINFADDEELMGLAAKAGCRGVFIGFESPTTDGLRELGKRFNAAGARDFRASVQRIKRHKILVVGSFIIGLDIDGVGIGQRVAEAAKQYGVTNLNALLLTPLPGTRLWERMAAENRIVLDQLPEDWKHYTMGFPVAHFKGLSLRESIDEVESCNRSFYSLRAIAGRVGRDLLDRRQPVTSLISNLVFRRNARLSFERHAEFLRDQSARFDSLSNNGVVP